MRYLFSKSESSNGIEFSLQTIKQEFMYLYVMFTSNCGMEQEMDSFRASGVRQELLWSIVLKQELIQNNEMTERTRSWIQVTTLSPVG